MKHAQANWACLADHDANRAACSAPKIASRPGVTATPTVPASDLTLTGRLIFTGSAQSLAQYDLADQQFSTLYEAPNNAFISSEAVSPDAYVIFSAVELPATSSTFDFYRWLGVQVAEAHNIPSDLWRVPVASGQPERLTYVGCTGLFASFSPDGRYLAFVCSAGIFVMNPDGTNLRSLNARGGIGTMEWIP